MRNVLFLLFCLSAYSAQANDTSSIVGKWRAAPKGDEFFFYFTSDSMMKIIHGTDTTNAKYNLYTDSTAEVMFLIDIHVIDRMSGEVLYTNKGIYQWMGPNRMRLRWSESLKDRPRNFFPKGSPDILVLTKQP